MVMEIRRVFLGKETFEFVRGKEGTCNTELRRENTQSVSSSRHGAALCDKKLVMHTRTLTKQSETSSQQNSYSK